MKKNQYKPLVAGCLFALMVAFSGCNEYDTSFITVTMVNQSTSSVYMWVERYEVMDSSNLLAPNRSRVFWQALTFTEEHPRTQLTVVGSKNDVITSTVFVVNSDTTAINAAYNSSARIVPF